jgi:putative ABC transport system permease protein
MRAGRTTTLASVAALALGVAACATAAAIAYAGLLRPLPFRDDGRLVTLRRVFKPTENPSSIRINEFEPWRTSLAQSMSLAAYGTERATVRTTSAPEEVTTAVIAGPFFDVVGVTAIAGQLIDGNSEGKVVVTRAFARRVSGSTTAAIGQTFTLGTTSVRIVGIVPDSLAVLDVADVWRPSLGAADVPPIGLGQAGQLSYSMIARVHDGVSLEQARADVARVTPLMAPANQAGNWRTDVRGLRDTLIGQSRPVLIVFLAASLLIMGVACANATLLLVNRAVSRTREFAVRLALGATPWALRRLVVTEAAVISTAATLSGGAIAILTLRTLQGFTALSIPRLATAAPIGLVAAAGAIAWCVMLLVCSVAPIVIAQRGVDSISLRSGTGGSRANRRVRGMLVTVQLAMSTVLLVSTGLLGRTLWQVSHSDIGVDDQTHVLTAAVPINQSLVTDPAARRANVLRITDEIRKLPGVISAGFGSNLPPAFFGIAFTVRYTSNDRDATRTFDLVPVTDGYLEALGARLVQGRTFTQADLTSGAHVIVLSETALRHLYPAGPTVQMDGELNMAVPGPDGKRAKPRIIGVVKDIRYAGLDADARGALYLPWGGVSTRTGYLITRTSGDPKSLASSVAQVVRTIDATMPAGQVRSLDDEVSRTLAPRTARFGLVGVFAVAAILLAIVGLFSALIRSVMERQRELAIRAAVGASPSRLLRSVFGQGLMLTVSGIAIGLGLAAAGSQMFAGLLHDVAPRDPLTYVATGLTLLATSVAACWLPARRAAASDPVILLRSE